MAKGQHVTPRPDGKWQHIGAGNSRATRVFDTQKEAIKAAKKTAKNKKSELVIHGNDGKIRKKDSYGHDPRTSKG